MAPEARAVPLRRRPACEGNACKSVCVAMNAFCSIAAANLCSTYLGPVHTDVTPTHPLLLVPHSGTQPIMIAAPNRANLL